MALRDVGLIGLSIFTTVFVTLPEQNSNYKFISEKITVFVNQIPFIKTYRGISFI